MTFQPGQSGNPAGRPRGSRNKRTIIAEKILDDHAADVTQTAIGLAMRGDGPALRMCLDRIAPPMRHRLLDFDLPALKTADDAVVAADLIVQGAAHGELTVQEATVLMKLVRTFTLVLAAADRAKRKAQAEAPPAEDMARLPDRDAARDDHVDDDMAIAAQGAPLGVVAAAKVDETPQRATQDMTRQTMTAASASPQPRAPARATAPVAALRTPLDRSLDVDDTFAKRLAEAMASVRPADIPDGGARRDPSRSGHRAAAAA